MPPSHVTHIQKIKALNYNLLLRIGLAALGCQGAVEAQTRDILSCNKHWECIIDVT